MNLETELPSFTQLSVRLGTLTHPGGMSNNEDACALIECEGGVVAVVADGAGGSAHGEVASAMVVDHVREVMSVRSIGRDDGETITGLLQGAQQRIRDAIDANARFFTMRTTAVIVFATRAGAVIGHVGDSRAYLVRGGEPTLLTRDDTLVQTLVDLGDLDQEAAKGHPQSNVLLQSLGDERGLEYHVSEEFAARAGDTMVVCSDGLSDVLTDGEIASLSVAATPEAAADRLMARALQRGARDNVTIVVLQWHRSARTKRLVVTGSATNAHRTRKKTRSQDAFPIVAILLLSLAALAVSMAFNRRARTREGLRNTVIHGTAR